MILRIYKFINFDGIKLIVEILIKILIQFQTLKILQKIETNALI